MEGAVEPIILLAFWMLGICFIRVYRELRVFRNLYNQHRDIYVPSYEELMKVNHWSIQLTRFLINEFKKARKNNINKRMYPTFESKSDMAVLALASNSKKSKTSVTQYEEYEIEESK